MEKGIIDGMKNEGKPFRNLMIFSYVLTVLMPLFTYLMNNCKYSRDMLWLAIAWFLFGTFGLYGWLYAIKYKVEFNEEKVYLKTLFKKIEFNIRDVEKYICNRYRKSVFYQFRLFIKGKKILINTRYKDEFEKILKDNKIEQIIE